MDGYIFIILNFYVWKKQAFEFSHWYKYDKIFVLYCYYSNWQPILTIILF